MLRCYFCLNERLPGNEHVFPLAIGGHLRTSRVCQDCNSYLGAKVDSKLSNHPFMAVKRSEFGLAGQSGTIPDAVLALLGRGTLDGDPTQHVHMVRDKLTGRYAPQLQYREVETELPDGQRQVSAQVDLGKGEGEVRKVINRIRKRYAMEPLSGAELESAVATAMANVTKIERPVVHVGVEIDIVAYKKAILKIAYELACLWIGDAYLNDPVAGLIRDFILNDADILSEEDTRFRGCIGFDRLDAFKFWEMEAAAHVGFLYTTGSLVVVAIKLFDCMEATLMVSAQSTAYSSDPDPPYHRFVRNSVKPKFLQQSTFPEELERLARKGLNDGKHEPQ